MGSDVFNGFLNLGVLNFDISNINGVRSILLRLHELLILLVTLFEQVLESLFLVFLFSFIPDLIEPPVFELKLEQFLLQQTFFDFCLCQLPYVMMFDLVFLNELNLLLMHLLSLFDPGDSFKYLVIFLINLEALLFPQAMNILSSLEVINLFLELFIYIVSFISIDPLLVSCI